MSVGMEKCNGELGVMTVHNDGKYSRANLATLTRSCGTSISCIFARSDSMQQTQWCGLGVHMFLPTALRVQRCISSTIPETIKCHSRGHATGRRMAWLHEETRNCIGGGNQCTREIHRDAIILPQRASHQSGSTQSPKLPANHYPTAACGRLHSHSSIERP